jgi:hypothetical protein
MHDQFMHLFSTAIRQLILPAFRSGNTNTSHGTDGAPRINRRAHQRPEFHQGLVECAGIVAGQDFFRDRPEPLLRY